VKGENVDSTAGRRTILVEVRKDPVATAILEPMADTCRAMGHEVLRWRGPLSGRMPYGRWLPVCDLAILFNGAHRSYRPALARLRAWGAAMLMVELGWFPQAGHYQVDRAGVNSAASWAHDNLEVEGHTRLAVRNTGDLLLLLQLNDDTQITERSAWFSGMDQLVRFVCRHSALPVRVRSHPKAGDRMQLRQMVAECGASWDDATTLSESLDRCRAVACVNSSAAVEAMAHRLPVLCYGDAVYRHDGAVYCLTDDGVQTRAATDELLGGTSSLYLEKMAAVVDRIVSKQWTAADVPKRLPDLVDSLLAETPSVRPTLNSNDRVEQTIHWIADLPAKVLYRSRLRRIATR
jgi:hypothetical protein